MQLLEPLELLELWEHGQVQHPVDRALTLLGALHRDISRQELAEWPLGQRDAGLLALYSSHYGDALQATGNCPDCTQAVDAEIRIADLSNGEATEPGGEVTVDDTTIRFRLPNSLDLGAIAGCRDLAAARAELARRCVSDRAVRLSEKDITALAAAIETSDPRTEISLRLTCPECECQWNESLDVTAFLWAHVAAQAKRLLWQVDRLASAYGWTEDDVLALSPARRQWYVEAAG